MISKSTTSLRCVHVKYMSVSLLLQYKWKGRVEVPRISANLEEQRPRRVNKFTEANVVNRIHGVGGLSRSLSRETLSGSNPNVSSAHRCYL